MNKSVLLAGACAIGLTLAAPASALIVYDPTNYSQNLLSAVRALEQINNQITSIQNEAQMLINQAKNLTSLDFSALNDLKQTIAKTKSLIDQAQGLSFDIDSMEQQFKQLYPQEYAASVSNDDMVQQARERWERSREALETAMLMQSQVSENLGADEGTLGDLVNRSQSAAGILEATQATNQLLALQAKQAIDAARLKLAQDRAVAAEQARAITEEERAREVRRRFMGDGNGYSPATVRLFRD
ncbi:P-type conjugative transfer protein TrbJ [Aquamicrobium sp. LC103]|uniref:P-type conjugative transfer protein TrbJ n=1 Tax=Aquamicrobium sp. LC103 TaxID=1120658 RepID=UPI00063EC142|nr:P-type conjugative transfer protein TrbJ [Aquamicrobium sp. LC103]TKT82444.1 P-type conjugative transfer protein TrbJ [Aquamicrobium sp. LC103]